MATQYICLLPNKVKLKQIEKKKHIRRICRHLKTVLKDSKLERKCPELNLFGDFRGQSAIEIAVSPYLWLLFSRLFCLQKPLNWLIDTVKQLQIYRRFFSVDETKNNCIKVAHKNVDFQFLRNSIAICQLPNSIIIHYTKYISCLQCDL